ncbi:Rhodanese-like protein [Macroventuria anomochaeta]|uniref:Rhodanese-like protein n=1 Tax=Macroventuria anomochaeta TaxID=301207 RepID=A0ACB6RN39_9PLEO|nr:Rhodanese-like protein [Macroventuria anomochaeta]KAF2623296.1 Rhodanese-like protein [Macroventuria anomochaeta]
MASKTASMALRLGTRTAQRTAARAVVLPTKEASMGLRNFTTASRNISNLQLRPAISIAGQVSQRRYISERPDGRGRIYDFEDVLSILENPSDSRLLIDVREPHEFGTNSIPTAINLPITSHPDALLLSPAEFQDQFGFAKPPTGKEMVFFCKAGVRSKAAASIARQAGYTNVGEYQGSWDDWKKRGGPGTKTPPQAGGVGERTGPVTETKISGGKTSGEEDIGTQGVPQPPKGGQFGTQ